MRRSDREITDMDRIMEIVRRQGVCCVAFQDTPCPYLIPMNYGAALENGRLTLYFHGAAVGTKLDRLNADPHVSFTIVGGSQVSLNFEEACRSTAGFDSVCGTGTAELVPAEEKRPGGDHEPCGRVRGTGCGRRQRGPESTAVFREFIF